MKQLFKAVYNHFTSTSTGARKAIYTDVGGRFYLLEAPENPTFPYITYQIIAASHEWNFNTDYEDITMQFNIFSDAVLPTSIMNMYGDLDTCFNNARLNTSGYSHLFMVRKGYFPQRYSLDIPAKPVWHYAVEYDLYLKKL